MISEFVAASTSFGQVLAQVASIRRWYPDVRTYVPIVDSGDTADLARPNILDGLCGLCDVVRSCYAFSLAGEASSTIQSPL